MNACRITNALAAMHRSELAAGASRARLVPETLATAEAKGSHRDHFRDDTQGVITDSGTGSATDRARLAASNLYDAECALHAAHQSRVEAWIVAANDKLHLAASEYVIAVGALPPASPAVRRDAVHKGSAERSGWTSRRAGA